MKKDITITVRIPIKMKEELKRYGVEVSKVVRKSLEEEIKKRKLEELKNAAGRLGVLLAKIPDDEIIRTIREARESR